MLQVYCRGGASARRRGDKKDGHPLRGFPPSLNSRFPLYSYLRATERSALLFPVVSAPKRRTSIGPCGCSHKGGHGRLHTLCRLLDIEHLRELVAILAPVYFRSVEVGGRNAGRSGRRGRNKGEEEVARGRNPGWGFLPFALHAEAGAKCSRAPQSAKSPYPHVLGTKKTPALRRKRVRCCILKNSLDYSAV